MTEINRRQTLCLASVSLAALAGCSESSDDDPDDTVEGDGDLPSWASMLPETDRSQYFYGAIDIETMSTLLEDEAAEEGEEPTDPLVGNPVLVAFLSSYGLTLLSNSPGAQSFSDHDESADGDATFVYANGVYAILGQYDYDGLGASLESNGYARETDDESFGIYTDSDTGEIVGITDEVYAFSYPDSDDSEFDAQAAVETLVTTATGEQEPKHATDEDFEWLLRAGESSGIALGLYTDDELDAATIEGVQQDDTDDLDYAFDAFEGARGVHQHLSIGDGDAYANAIVEYADEDRIDVDRLESSLGTDADSVNLTRDGTTVSIASEYGGDLS